MGGHRRRARCGGLGVAVAAGLERHEVVAELNIPTGIPLVYELGDDYMPLEPGRYLDPEAAAAGAAAVAAQGKK